MNQKNIFHKTPQFVQFISQFSQQSKDNYAQIFITKSPNSSFVSSNQAGQDNVNSASSQKSSSDSSSLASAPQQIQPISKAEKNSSGYQNGNEQIQAQWGKKIDTLNKQTEQQNQQNLLKRGKQCVQSDSGIENIPTQSYQDYQDMQKQQIIIEEQRALNQQYQKEQTSNQDSSQKQQSGSIKKKAEVNVSSKAEESTETLSERIKLHQQLMLLPKNERNKALLSQKKRDERWEKEPISVKEVASISNKQTEQERKKAIEEMRAQHKMRKQLKQEKKDQYSQPIDSATFDNYVQQLKQSGQVTSKQDKRAIKDKLINEMLADKDFKQIQKQINDVRNNQENASQNIDGANGVKRHKQKNRDKKYSYNLKSSDEDEQGQLNSINKAGGVQLSKEKTNSNKSNGDQKNKVSVSVSNKLEGFLENQLNVQHQYNTKQYPSKKYGNKKQEQYDSNQDDNNRQDKYSNKKDHKNNNKKRTFQSFEPYWSSQEIEKAIQEKRAFKGIYIANEKNQYLGRLKCDDISGVVFVNSHIDQNRALHNCVVGFTIIEGDPSSRLKNIPKTTDSNLKNIKLLNQNDEELEVEEELNQSIEDGQENDEDWETDSDEGKAPAAAAKVDQTKLVAKIVYIYENPYKTDKIVGYLQELQEERNPKRGKSDKKKYWFIPKFTKLPKMIPIEFTEEFTRHVQQNAIDITKSYVIGQIKEWKDDSFYPLAKIIECLGQRGDIEVECDTLLQEFNIYNEDFTSETEEYLSKYREHLNEKGEYIIPDIERQIRWDLTNEIICTIDPHDAKDLDDALSVKHLHDDIYEIGVHIADVSHFVQPNTPLDEDARLRTTSVYLVHRVIPMLPRLLCENLCSLNPNVERLAFTVFFQMKENGEVLWDGPIRIGKSIIKSCSKLSYDVVQEMIENKIKTPDELPEGNKPKDGVDKNKMFESILLLSKLGMKRREQRFVSGVLSIESVKKRFRLNESLWPIDYKLEERKDANFVVEEFMLLANQIIGKAMVKECKSIAVLRQHCYPSVEKQKNLNEVAKKFGHEFDFTSLESINKSIERIKADDKLSFEKKLYLKKQMFLVLEQALYFVADQLPETEWRHFALNFDVYTHFTSPIRRYPDLLVHRVMYSILQNKSDAVKLIDKQSLLSIMDQCNENKAKSKQVSDNCQKDHCVESKGMVASFGATSMSVFIPDHEILKTVYFQDYKDIIKAKIEKEKEGNRLVIIYKTKKMTRQSIATFTEFSPITASLTSTDTFPIDYKVKLTLPDADDKKINHIIE